MKSIGYGLVLLLVLAACHRDNPDTVQPEYTAWYILRSPDAGSIDAVWGDIDRTVVIASTTLALYRTTDRGESWQQVYAKNQPVTGLVMQKDTLFATSGMLYAGGEVTLVNTALYSIDLGATWLTYHRINPTFDLVGYAGNSGIKTNPVTATNGVTYTIRRQYLNDSTKIRGRFITPGVVTQTGRQIDLPKRHQLRSLALDAKGRLYAAGSDEVCELSPNFRYCNGGKGVVYVSKNPLP